MTRFLIYCLSMIMVSFAISGINFDKLLKKNHIWEARFLAICMIMSMTYLIANFIIDVMNLNLIN